MKNLTLQTGMLSISSESRAAILNYKRQLKSEMGNAKYHLGQRKTSLEQV